MPRYIYDEKTNSKNISIDFTVHKPDYMAKYLLFIFTHLTKYLEKKTIPPLTKTSLRVK